MKQLSIKITVVEQEQNSLPYEPSASFFPKSSNLSRTIVNHKTKGTGKSIPLQKKMEKKTKWDLLKPKD